MSIGKWPYEMLGNLPLPILYNAMNQPLKQYYLCVQETSGVRVRGLVNDYISPFISIKPSLEQYQNILLLNGPRTLKNE